MIFFLLQNQEWNCRKMKKREKTANFPLKIEIFHFWKINYAPIKSPISFTVIVTLVAPPKKSSTNRDSLKLINLAL